MSSFRNRCVPFLLLLGAAATPACGTSFQAAENRDGGAGGMPDGGTSGASGSAGAQSGAAGSAAPASGGSSGRGGAGQGGSAAAGRSGAGGNDGEAGSGGGGAAAGTESAGGRGAGGGSGGVSGAGGSAQAGSGAGAFAQGGSDVAGAGGIAGSSGSAGSGGSSGSDAGAGGSSGSGGSGGSAGGNPCLPVLLIDDMEDGNDLVCPNEGRSGDWWAATGTPTGSIDPPSQGNFPAFALGLEARGASRYGMRLSGQNFGQTEDDWASLGFYLAGELSYDLSPYQGLAFYAKSRSAAIELHVKFATSTTTPTSEGGGCLDDCNDHYRSSVNIDGTWREFALPFASLAQEGWGVKAKDLEHTLFVYFGFLGTDLGPPAFDFLIDDVRLY